MKRPRSETSVRRKSHSWNVHEIRLEREDSQTDDLLIVDTEDLKVMHKIQIKRDDHSEKTKN